MCAPSNAKTASISRVKAWCGRLQCDSRTSLPSDFMSFETGKPIERPLFVFLLLARYGKPLMEQFPIWLG